MKARFIAPAQQELDEAIEYYNSKVKGLGDELFGEVISSAQALLDFPELWPKVRKNIRRCRIKRFPYSLLYSINIREILIIALMHDKQQPRYCLKRLKDT
ncbi:MAG: type II toxin-antitoxin system RelE/ParE family toxin [Hyphomicrobiales bacterium]|nr:type II toxin-antitoxin system RelE/ParE family toxin [Hyphomicrobiales bacterium]